MTNPVAKTLICGCTFTTDGQRHWCIACSTPIPPDVLRHPQTQLCDAALDLLDASQFALEILTQHIEHYPEPDPDLHIVVIRLTNAIAKAISPQAR